MCELSELREGREIFGWWQSKISGKHLDSLQPTGTAAQLRRNAKKSEREK